MADLITRPTSTDVGPSLESLAAQLQLRYLRILRQTLFTNRSEVRPTMLRNIAAHETQALLEFFFQPSPQKVAARGIQHAQTGLSEETILGLAQTSRQFIIENLGATASVTAMNTADSYYHALLKGFLQGRERIILDEQERIRSALQKTLRRYAVQMEVTAGVAGATSSILDLDTLLKAAVQLIWKQFSLLYVGLFLLEEKENIIRLKAGTGTFGQTMLPQNFQATLHENLLISRTVATGKTQIILDVTKDPNPTGVNLIQGTKSQAAIPLFVRGSCIGTLSLHSHKINAFTDLELVTFNILAEQLASAIGNARLFADLSHSEEKYRTILENIEEGYYEIDLDGQFIFTNDSVSQIFETTARKIIGVPYQNFFDPAYLNQINQAIKLVSQTGRYIKSIESKVYRPDETGRFVEISMLPIHNVKGERVGLRGTIRDITQRKQSEQLRIEQIVLERSNQELEQFAYVASHDLQEPLNKIQLFGDRLVAKNRTKLDDTSQDYLKRMLKATDRMQTLIDNLLTLSQVATKGRPFVSTNLSKILEEVISDLETRLDSTNGKIEAGPLPTIEADPIQMHQLLQNIIGNGLKFHRQNVPPIIELSAKLPIKRPGHKRIYGGGYCQIIIKDNGIGFEKKYAGRIFQPFQRLHGHHTYEGTGMGLAICQRIVDRHAGQINVRSIPNEGSTFTITLPINQTIEKFETGI